uniref:Uncharacterized protein n=1 Tax=Arundo donax TaxID=35708 RepID=A0A0A9A1W7_ARUDO
MFMNVLLYKHACRVNMMGSHLH